MPTEIVGTMAVSGGQKQTALLMPGAYPAERVTYNGTNVDDTLDEMLATKRGTQVNVLDYTTADPYVAPTDGYLICSCLASGQKIDARVLSSDGATLAAISLAFASADQRASVYLRKGMKIAVITKVSSPGCVFSPITL